MLLLTLLQLHPDVLVDDDVVLMYGLCTASLEKEGYVRIVFEGRQTRLHQLVLATPGLLVDHINLNKKDNRKVNLRAATRAQNNMNRGKSSTNSTGYKGVSLNKATGKYTAYISRNNQQINLGYFDTPERAADAYRIASSLYHGEFAAY